MSEKNAGVLAFYDGHPISAERVLARVAAARGSLDGIGPADLFAYDQDHYGGLEANDALHGLAHIGAGSLVLDLCAGIGGPARYCAYRRGARLWALELNAGRAAGAGRLNRLTGLDGLVSVVRADAQAPPFADASFDAVMGQEAFLHVPDKRRLLDSALRVLKPGGRIAFSDWTATPGLPRADLDRLRDNFAAVGVQTIDGYRAMLGAAGFAGIEAEDRSADMKPILTERLAMYERLREEARGPGGKDPHAGYIAGYRHFVALVLDGRLGGARYVAVCP